MCSDFFHCPAYKLMISDIKSAIPKPPHLDSEEPEEREWTFTLTEIPTSTGQPLSLKSINESKPSVELDLKMIWVQGVVLRMEENPDDGSSSLVITDDEEEHEALIQEHDTVPGGDSPEIKIGAYIGALGEIWSNSPKIIIKATKLMHLDGKPLHRRMWNDEVRLGKAFLAGMVQFVV